MVKLFCAIVGVAGSAFEVDIDDAESVSALKKSIKAEKPNDFKDVDADKLQLFLAKTADGAWLSSPSEDVKKLKKGEKTALIKALTKEDQELQAENPLEDVLIGMDPPSARQIHVLVVTVFSITAFIRSSRNSRRLTKLVIGSNFRRCYR
ncbi:hypothetical protein PC113_g24537 [Phytophthora cactorum]|uniref:Crinkler effector protein N-terminal domain-containing protein n=1 Tax=Phytophthora cactorum TaxID=29920 RepID=A0A8T0XYW7_9STRA|nr:hypothetical protein PC113_g24537 [Phytophthora cactorum]